MLNLLVWMPVAAGPNLCIQAIGRDHRAQGSGRSALLPRSQWEIVGAFSWENGGVVGVGQNLLASHGDFTRDGGLEELG